MAQTVVVGMDNPVDRAFLKYSRDISVTPAGAEAFMDDFQSQKIKQERILPVESVFVFTSMDEGLKFNNFRDANKLLQEMAKEAPSEKEGADSVTVMVDWQNKNGPAFKGFSSYIGKVHITKEMEHIHDIIQRSVADRYMVDSGVLKPIGIDETKWAKKMSMDKSKMIDRAYMVTTLMHAEGIRDKVVEKVQDYEKAVKLEHKTPAKANLKQRTNSNQRGLEEQDLFRMC